MIITLIADDGLVGVDGVFRAVDLAALEADIHAVQFDTGAGHGEVEYRRDPLRPQGNRAITDFSAWQWAFAAWVAAAPLPPAPPAPETLDQVQARLDNVVTDWIDRQAASAGFRNAAYLISYWDSTNQDWQRIARAFVPWRDAVWAKCIEIVAAVRGGQRAVPTEAELIAALPALVLP